MRGAICIVLLAVTSYVASDAPLVRTPLGNVTGSVLKSRDQKEFYAYTSLPYAKPPVRELRFKEAEPIGKWNLTYSATKPLPMCPQVNLSGVFHGQEDCLYLNVFTRNVTAKAPVLVYIHGGAFMSGSGNFGGPEYLMDYAKDMVIVAINYRLGILGFLSLEDDTLPGNLGLKDQTAALKWVKDNIQSFGGDPGRVTLIGESAGGASVYSHILSPLSKGLFHRVIAQSGTPYSPWALSAPGAPKRQAETQLRFLNCTTSSKEAVQCLRNKNVVDLLKIDAFPKIWEVDPAVVWGPVMEPKDRKNGFFVGALKDWAHENVPIILGTTSGEGLIRTLPMLKDKNAFPFLSKNFTDIVPISLEINSTSSKPKNVAEKLKDFYFSGKANITIKDWKNLTDMYTDAWFTGGVLDGVNSHSSGNVFVYYWDYILKSLIPADLGQDIIFGAIHTTDHYFIWKAVDDQGYEKLTTKGDHELSKKMVDIVGQFVYSGSPVDKNSALKWEKWTEKEHNYLLVNRTGGLTPATDLGPLEKRYSFWKSLPYRDLIDNAFHNSASLTTTVSSLICFSVLFNIARTLVA